MAENVADMPNDFGLIDRRRNPYFRVDNAVLITHGAALKAHGIAVYCALSMHANTNDQCWPSFQTIARLLGMSRSQVIREIKKLEELGLIRKTSLETSAVRGGRRNIYELLDLPPVQPTSKQQKLPFDGSK